ncbi:MAG TPA: hypothetical protein VNT99_18890, partial [Methylomirabilota bacterium]|nr:hypothetical protein [Methylomirabilota bacterium]
MKRLHNRFAVRVGVAIALAAFLSTTSSLKAQIPVGVGGTPANDFSVTPPATEWATLDITTGSASTYANPAALDAGAQTLSQSAINTPLAVVTADTTAIRLARHSTTSFYLATQPTGVPAAVLKATLRNTSGGGIGSFTVSYNYGIAVNPVTDEVPGQRVFYSLSGEAETWVLIPELSGVTTAGLLSATLNLGVWLDNADMYLLFLDDNNLTGTDGAFTIDNFAISSVIPAVITPITLTNSPSSITVAERGNATFTVVAGGAPRDYYWFSNGVQVAGNNQATFTIPSAAYPDNNNAQILVVISNSLSFVTSTTATLTVTPDTTAPTVIRAVAEADPGTVTVTFSEPMDPNFINEGNFTVFETGTDPDASPYISFTATTTDGTNVVISSDPRVAGVNHSVRILDLRDAS